MTTGSALGRVVLGGGVFRPRDRAARLHQLEDPVAALDDGAVGRDEQLALLAVLGILGDRVVEADLLGVLDQVERGGRLRDAGEDRVLGE